MFGDIVAELLDNQQAQQYTQAAVKSMRMHHKCSLQKQVQKMVDKHVKEPSEGSILDRKPHLGRLSQSLGALQGLLSKAQYWFNLQGYEGAFRLALACADKGSDFEARGNDGMSWDDFDKATDILLCKAAAHIADDWEPLKLQSLVEDMEATQKSGSDYGYDSVWTTTLP